MTDDDPHHGYERRIGEIVCRLAGLPRIDAELDYFDAGLASIQALELLSEVETTFEVSLLDEEFVRTRTVRDLAQLVSATAGGGVR